MTLCQLKLADRIARRYRTCTVNLRLEGLNLPFTRIADPDSVLDAAVEAEDRRKREGSDTEPPRVPYWAEIWESALGLGQLIGQSDVQGKSVLDLGCGMGLAGAAAAAAGARVLLADVEPDALLFARFNTMQWTQRVRVRRLNWQRDRLSEKFDLILGADILYERSQWEFLDQFWRIHLKEGGRVLLGEPGRQTGDIFPLWARTQNWDVQESTQAVSGKPTPVRVFNLSNTRRP
jgi:predicted nicotinamide N-methyase